MAAVFSDARPAGAAAKTEAAKTPVDQPPEVIWKPEPMYTEAARAKHIEGTVVMEVVFPASGDVRVLRVISGLGFGLDESARNAAARIRFRPGLRDGVPADTTGIVRIVFELS
jgi:protein TonB